VAKNQQNHQRFPADPPTGAKPKAVAGVPNALGGVIFGGHPKTPYLFARTLTFSLNWHCRTHPDTF